MEHWQYFWQTYALGRLASTGRVFGAEFKFGSEAYSWVESNLGARLSCNAIAKFMNDKFGSKHCVRFMCSSPDSGSVADDYSGSRRIYLINSIPEYFK